MSDQIGETYGESARGDNAQTVGAQTATNHHDLSTTVTIPFSKHQAISVNFAIKCSFSLPLTEHQTASVMREFGNIFGKNFRDTIDGKTYSDLFESTNGSINAKTQYLDSVKAALAETMTSENWVGAIEKVLPDFKGRTSISSYSVGNPKIQEMGMASIAPAQTTIPNAIV